MTAVEQEKGGRYERKSPSRGGRREGAGAPVLSPDERFARRQEREREATEYVQREAERLIEVVGLPPRRRLLEGENVEERTDGPWLANFCRLLCRQTIGRWKGAPLEFYPEQQAFLDELLEFDDEGQRLFGMGVWEIPRKNGKTTSTSALSVALTSPAEGEGAPECALAAGSKDQAGKLFKAAAAFVRGDPILSSVYMATATSIICASTDGVIERVAGDGKLNHGRNDYVIAADELHAWTTPRQVENWAALTTSDGARDDALVVVITTAGFDPKSILGQLHAEALASPFCERRPEMGGGGFITRDLEARLLVHCYAIAPGTGLDDLDEFKRANPAPWRTQARIAQDLRKRLDEGTKRRLYGNEWTSAKDAWIRRDAWKACEDRAAFAEAFQPGAREATGVDASLTHDTTCVAEAELLDDGRVALRTRVWSVRPEVAAHDYFPGSRIELEDVENHIAGSLLRPDAIDVDLVTEYALLSVGYDPRYFNRSAEMLSKEGVTTVRYEPNSTSYFDAVQSFYNLVAQRRIVHDGDPVLAAHIDACAGVKSDRGWKLSKLKATLPIDAVPASIIAVDLAVNGSGRSFIFIDPFAAAAA